MTTSPPQRDEDFLVMSSLTVRGKVVVDVPCKVFLPPAPPGKPELSFRPSLDQFQAMSAWHEGEFAAVVPGMKGGTQVELASERVYFEDMVTKYWGHNVSECHLTGFPQNLRTIRYLRPEQRRDVCDLVFWITPNAYLSPALIISNHFTGEVECERVYKRTFDLGPIKVEYDRHFFELAARKGESRRTSCLVGCSSYRCNARDVKRVQAEVLPVLDDFLLFASLACRTRTACVGWQAEDGETLTAFYRGFLSYPNGVQVRTLDRGLVDMADFELFTASAFHRFQASSRKAELRGATFAVLGSEGQTVESAFLSMYAALEDLLLGFRKDNQLEIIFNDVEWKSMKDGLRSWIKSGAPISIEKDKRQHVYAKLDELNRIPARWAFEEMCRRLGVDLADLWPVFGDGPGVSLSAIRNRLIHGGFPSEGAFALATALDHLQWTLERVLLALLGWSVDRSEVRPAFLARLASSMAHLSRDRDGLTAALGAVP